MSSVQSWNLNYFWKVSFFRWKRSEKEVHSSPKRLTHTFLKTQRVKSSSVIPKTSVWERRFLWNCIKKARFTQTISSKHLKIMLGWNRNYLPKQFDFNFKKLKAGTVRGKTGLLKNLIREDNAPSWYWNKLVAQVEASPKIISENNTAFVWTCRKPNDLLKTPLDHKFASLKLILHIGTLLNQFRNQFGHLKN